MNPLVRNVLAVVIGFVSACVVNMVLIVAGGLVVAPPAGADLSTAEGIQAAMPRMTPVHFLMPFLAHAIGTLAGGFVAAITAASHKLTFALIIGVIFLALGGVMIRLVGGPVWFIVLDLGLAYVPMAWIGGKLGTAQAGRR